MENEIEKLLNTLTGASAVLMSYANGKIEELDTRRQGLIKEIAALNAESVLFNGVFTIVKRGFD